MQVHNYSKSSTHRLHPPPHHIHSQIPPEEEQVTIMATSTAVEAPGRCPALHKDSRMKHCPPTTPFSKQAGNGLSDSISQSASHPLSPTQFLHQSGSSTSEGLWWEICITSKDMVDISVPCNYLKIQKASSSGPLVPGKRTWAGALHALPASCLPRGILHSPLTGKCTLKTSRSPPTLG